MGIFALVENGKVTQISILPVPDFFFDETLDPDHEVLRGYQRKGTDGLTLEYFEKLMGVKGNISGYSSGYFIYTWRSSAFYFSVDVDRNDNVSTAYFWDLSDPEIVNGGLYQQGFFVIPDSIRSAMDELTREMEKNNGVIAVEKAKSIIKLDFRISENRMIFESESNASIVVFMDENEEMIDEVFLWLPFNVYINESLPFTVEELEAMDDEIYKMNLAGVQKLLEDPGTLFKYIQNNFTYVWITPNFSVQLLVDGKGAIEYFAVSRFDG